MGNIEVVQPVTKTEETNHHDCKRQILNAEPQVTHAAGKATHNMPLHHVEEKLRVPDAMLRENVLQQKTDYYTKLKMF
jgi:hypothetical protein